LKDSLKNKKTLYHAVLTTITALGLRVSQQKSDKNAYDNDIIEEIPNPCITCAIIIAGMDLVHPP